METQWEPLPDLRDVSDSPVDAALAGPLETRRSRNALHRPGRRRRAVDRRFTRRVVRCGPGHPRRPGRQPHGHLPVDRRPRVPPRRRLSGDVPSRRLGRDRVENPAHPRPERDSAAGTCCSSWRGKEVSPQLLVLREGAAARSLPIEPGKALDVELSSQRLSLTVWRFMDHAMVSFSARRARRRAKLRPARAGG